jgi:hypothetical protein
MIGDRIAARAATARRAALGLTAALAVALSVLVTGHVAVAAADPLGSFDGVHIDGETVAVDGWAYDGRKGFPTEVVFYDLQNGTTYLGATDTKFPRPDVTSAVPGSPPNPGWQWSTRLASGQHRICAYAIGGTNPLLGCRTIQTGDATRNPVGADDSLWETPTGIEVRGWAFDPDSTGSISVAVYDQTGAPIHLADAWATGSRPDVQRAIPGAIADSGYDVTLPESNGTHRICVYALNVGTGTENPLLGCRFITVNHGTYHDARGSFDAFQNVGNYKLEYDGWAYDPDATGGTFVDVWETAPFTFRLEHLGTGDPRPDIAAMYRGGGGFSDTLQTQDIHYPITLCAYAISVAPGNVSNSNPLLGCRTVTPQP